jgi:hypothetical protein
MNSYLKAFAALSLGFQLAPRAEGRTINFGPNAERIEVAYGKPTIFRFESAVKTISNSEKFEVGPASQEAPDYTTLVVQPRTTSGSDTVVFLLSDGTVAKLLLVPVSGAAAEKLETFHEVRGKSDTVAKKQEPDLESQFSEDETGEGKVELMKSLILGTKIRGYQIRELEKSLTTGLSGVAATLERVYTGSDYNGYVFKLTNKSRSEKYEIDIRRLKIGEPNLALMSQVDRKVVEPESTGRQVAFLTIVALPSSLSREVTLPVSWVKKEGGRK